MQVRRLGRTDIDVSLLALGTMTFGVQVSEADSHAQLDLALDRGVTLIDTAEMYSVPVSQERQGLSERIIGAWLKARGSRDKVVLATKVTGPAERITWLRDGRHRLDAKNIAQAIDDSLARLQTDYVDLYQVHWPERRTNFFGQLDYDHDPDDGAIPMEETFAALADLVKAGKARAIGLSNETPWGIMEALRLAEAHGVPRIVSVQNPYSLINRAFEVGLAEMALREDVGLLAYSPMGGGALSGKYLNGAQPEGARFTLYPGYFGRYLKPRAVEATGRYVALAREHGLDPAQMALAFVNVQPFLTSNVIGATTPAQLEADLASAELTLSEEVRAGIQEIHRDLPNPAP